MQKVFSLLIALLSISQLFAQSTIAKGSKVTILEIGKSDTYYGERADFVGTSATTLGTLNKNDNGFYSGTLETESGRTCFFKNVKVEVVNAGKNTTFSSDKQFSGTIPKGTRFEILEVPVDDSYYSSRAKIEGKKGTTTSSMTVDTDGYTTGNITTDEGNSYFFYKVRLGKTNSQSVVGTYSKPASKSVKFITGTIKKGTKVYVAEISPDDSYYSDRFDKVGKQGTVTKSDMTEKEDGYYAGDFTYDDGSTAYFYKAKFSKDPVDKLVKTETDKTTSNSSSDYSGWEYLFGGDDDDDWSGAKNDANIKEGDKVEITALNTEDSYYDDKDDYIGKKGVAGSDLSYDEDKGGYTGSVKLESGDKPYFYLVKLKKLSSTKSVAATNYGEKILKGTKVKVIDIDSDDSFYDNKDTYIGKSGKVAEGLTHQGNGLYSGKIIFTDGTDAYFYKVSVKKL
ncbi:MAG: hypothetical protein U0U67_10420 [Chitinophagales bacterium]